MTCSATDGSDWQPHLRNKPRCEILAQRFRDPNDPFQIIIVRDIWLTGCDAPGLHAMCADKPIGACACSATPGGGWVEPIALPSARTVA